MPATKRVSPTEAAFKAIKRDVPRDAKRVGRDVRKLAHNARRDMTRLARAVRTESKAAR